MTPGTIPWVVRSVRDWALSIQQGVGLVTFRSAVSRSSAIADLDERFQKQGLKAEVLQCAECTAEEFVDRIAASRADILFVLDPDLVLFGEKNDQSPFWVNFHREIIVGHPGVQIWWMLPNAAVRFAQQLPDLSRFFLFREELAVQEERTSNNEENAPPGDVPMATGDISLARDLLARAQQAASQSDTDVARMWLELGIPAISAFLRANQIPEAEEALMRLSEIVGSPEDALKPRIDNPVERVGWAFLILGQLYRRLGRFEDALAVTEEAVRFYRALVNDHPGSLRNLAGALNNLANRFIDLGRAEDALSPATEALQIRRQLVERTPDHSFSVATSLNSLSKVLSDLGRRDEALKCETEAVKIYRQRPPEDPDAFLPSLAGALLNFASMLGDMGRPEEGLAAAQEAAQIYRRLSADSPNGLYLAGLGASLDNLANKLSDLGFVQDALVPALEAVALRRQLAQEDPQGFLPDLARSLNNTANKLSRLNRPDEALPMVQDAVNIRRSLSHARPDAPGLATSLNNLANTLGMLNRDQEAVATAQEAVNILRKLSERRPDGFLPDLGGSLRTLASRLGALGRREEAIVVSDEALRIQRQLAQQNPDAFISELAKALALRGSIVVKDHPRDAIKFFEEAIRMLIPFYERHPQWLDGLLQSVRTSYMEATQAAGVAPNLELLAQD